MTGMNLLLAQDPTDPAQAVADAELCLFVARRQSVVAQMNGADSPFTERAIALLRWASWRTS